MKRTHTVDVYRPETVEGTRGERTLSFPDHPTISRVDCTIQRKSGELRQAAHGSEEEGTYQGFFPPGTDLQPKDGIRVVGGPGPDRLKVLYAHEVGDPWDDEVELELSSEDFG